MLSQYFYIPIIHYPFPDKLFNETTTTAPPEEVSHEESKEPFWRNY